MNLYRIVFDFREVNQAVITAKGPDEASVRKYAMDVLTSTYPDITDVKIVDIELIGETGDNEITPTNEGSGRIQ